MKFKRSRATAREDDAASAPTRSSRAALALIVTFFVLFTGFFVFLLVQSYNDTIDRTTERASAASQVVATNARWMTQVAQQSLRRMDSAVGFNVDANDGDAVLDMQQAADNLPETAKAYIVDANGNTLFSTDPEVRDTGITDREYFTTLEAGQHFYTSPLLTSRLNGEQIFVFSKRIERNGEFSGAAIISFDVSLLADFWLSLDLESGSTVSLIREDGQLVARFPRVDGPVDLSRSETFLEHMSQNEDGTYFATSAIDGIERVVGYHRVPGTNLIAVAAISLEQALSRYWRGIGLVLALIVPIAVGLAFAAIWITRLLARDAERQREISEALRTNTLLFREIHHRVKNNLQSMLSLVRIQNLPAEAKMDLQSRFVAMAAVHEHMYQHDAYAELVAADFVPSVVEPIVRAHATQAAVTYEIGDVAINHERATPLALLMNEIVTNALKYAFPDAAEGKITISLHNIEPGPPSEEGEEQPRRCRLVIADNGRGFDPESVAGGMGSRLIEGVVRQLDGTYAYENNHGTTFTAEISLS